MHEISPRDITTVLLVGGEGSRMRPLSNSVAKCMIPIMGRPLLRYTIEALRADGFTDIVLTSTGKNGEIEEYFGNGRASQVAIRYSTSREFRGTAGCVRDVLRGLGPQVSDPCMVIYGDSLLRTSYRSLLVSHQENEAQCTILTHRPRFEYFLYDHHDTDQSSDGPRTNYGVIEVDGSGRVVRFEEKPLLSSLDEFFSDPLGNATVSLMSNHLIEEIPLHGKKDFAHDMFPAFIKNGVRIYGHDIGGGYRLDIGTLATYHMVHLAILRGTMEFVIPYGETDIAGIWMAEQPSDGLANSDLVPPALLAEDVWLGSGSRVAESVIGRGVSIGASSEIEESVILDHVEIGNNVRLKGCIIGEHVKIEDDSVILPGTVLGDNSSLAIRDLGFQDEIFRGLLCRDQ